MSGATPNSAGTSSSSSTTTTTSSSSKAKPEQLIKELSKLKSNRYCFDCGRTGTQSQVNLTIGTFVCSSCGGLLRAFGHAIKTINMSTFTAQQATDMEKGGNKRAAKIWKARLDPAQLKLDIDNPAEIEKLMKAVYIEKKYYKEPGADKKDKKVKKGKDKDKEKEAKKSAEDDEEEDSDEESEDEKEKEKKKKKGKSNADKATGKRRDANENAANGSAPKEAAADSWGASSAAFPPAEKPKDGGIDFLSNLEFQETPIPAAQAGQNNQRLSFSAFTNSSAASNGHGVFGANSADGFGGSSSSSSSSGAVVSLRSGDDPAVQFLLNQLKLASKQFDLIPGELKAVVHTAMNMYEKELNGSKEHGKAIKAAHVDHFLDLDVQQEDESSSGNPFDDNFDENEPAIPAAFNPFGASASSPPVAVASPPPTMAPVSAPVYAPAGAAVGPVGINPYAVGVGVNPMLQQQLIIQQAQAQMQQLQLQQNLMLKQQQQQQFLQQQQAQAQAQLFNVPAATPPQAANAQVKQDLFAALNPF